MCAVIEHWGRSDWYNSHRYDGSLGFHRQYRSIKKKPRECLPGLVVYESGGLFRRSVSFGNLIPVDHIPKRGNVVRSSVLVVQVVSMFPNIQSKNWKTFDFSNVHQGIVLVGCRTHNQLSVCNAEPSPSRPKPCSSGFVKFFLKRIKWTEFRIDCSCQFTCRFASSIWRK